MSSEAKPQSKKEESSSITCDENSNAVLLARIAELEKENEKLKQERDNARKTSIFAISTPDIYSNLTKLQIDFRERFARNYESLRNGMDFDIRPWVDAAAASRKIDSKLIMEAIGDRRKRQFFACLVTFLLLPFSMLLTMAWVYFAIYDKTRILGLLLCVYATYIYFDKSHERGSKASKWFKQHWFWKLLCNYFPVILVKANPETVFDPNGCYMFGYHPHGIISAGCFVSFAANATGFSDMFPGIDIHAATLNTNFNVPFWRELILRLGVVSVSAPSLKYVLNKGPGNAVVVVPGGAAEALDARPGTHSLTLNRRQGFFRIALEHGASLVPIYSFGENDLYEQAPNDEGTLVRKFQNTFLKYLGFATPFFSGAGSGGAAIPMNPIPSRVPIITVVGDPIHCPKIDSPSQEDIDRVRVLYIESLQEIFKQFADKYAPARSSDLEILK